MSTPDDDLRELKWLLHNQAALDARLQRVEDSMVFRTLRAIGTFYKTCFQRSAKASARRYRAWLARHPLQPLAPDPSWTYQPLISLRCNEESIRGATLDSVRAQTYAHWKLNADGDYTASLNPGDILTPGCLASAVRAMQDSRPGLIYFDHQEVDEHGSPVRPVFKPDWSPVLQEECDYLGSFVLAAQEKADGVVHVPEILYSTRRCLGMKPPVPLQTVDRPPVSALICTRKAELLSRCLSSLREATDYPALEIVVIHHTGFADDRIIEELVKDRGAVRVHYSEQFNFADMNNRGARAASGAILLFLNDDVTALSSDWLVNMVARLSQPGVGAVGAKLLYPNGTIQHAGVATWVIDGAGHPGRNLVRSDYWPWLNCTREVSAVTGACLAIGKEDFERIGGFDPTYPVNYNDVDLCLRIRETGLSVIFEASALLRHDESRTRAHSVHFEERKRFFQQWSKLVEKVDPFYSPHLVQSNEDLSLRG